MVTEDFYNIDPKPEDENYQLLVEKFEITITSKNVIGAINGLTTLNQLIWCDGTSCEIPNSPWSISDEPKFSYRGILVDTSRNFISFSMLKEIVETMSLAKLNAIHLHLSDTASFSLEIDEIPETNQASYTNKTYSRKNI